jgi:PAP2 superfamily
MRFLPAEQFVLKVTIALFVLDAILLMYKGIGIDIVGYLAPLGLGVSAIFIGQFYRTTRLDHGISLALTATGTFILFTLVGSIFNYCLLPLRFPRVDTYFLELDAMFGFHWPWFATEISHYPIFSAILGIVYFSSLPQLILVILTLGFSKKVTQLHTFLLTGVIGALLTFIIWSFFPSFGATSIHDLPKEVLGRMPIAVNPQYGQELVRLGIEGTKHISPANVLGLIGFPSFHTVMALMSVVFLRQIKIAWPICLIINAIMIPAIIVQGGHHLSDLLGGLLVFVAAYVLSLSAMRQLQTEQGKLEHWQTASA